MNPRMSTQNSGFGLMANRPLAEVSKAGINGTVLKKANSAKAGDAKFWVYGSRGEL